MCNHENVVVYGEGTSLEIWECEDCEATYQPEYGWLGGQDEGDEPDNGPVDGPAEGPCCANCRWVPGWGCTCIPF